MLIHCKLGVRCSRGMCKTVGPNTDDGQRMAEDLFGNDGRKKNDFVWLATGGALDMNLVPILGSLLAQRPIPTAAGLPQLQQDLSWDAQTPLHIMGAFAQLELGPDALNLAGARSGSAIIARTILEAKQ